MALPVLDGNQSATTLSSVVTGGEHIVAHTVVSLGSTAIANITSAVSGSVVSISNFPSTQTIAGTVTANLPYSSTNPLGVTFWNDANQLVGSDVPLLIGSAVTVAGNRENVFLNVTSQGSPIISGTVTVGNSVTVAGTVTANVPLLNNTAFFVTGADVDTIRTVIYSSANGDFGGDQGAPVDSLNPLPVSVKNEISGTVTVSQLPRVTFIDGSGTVVTANSAVTLFASSTTRSYLLVQVTTGSAFVNVGATATTVNGINLTAGQGYAWETTIPQGIVSLISTTTSSRYVAKEA